MAIPVEVLEAAAQALDGNRAALLLAAPLLRGLGWHDAPDEPELRADRIRLLRVASTCRRVFQLRAPDAPGMHCFGAEFDLAEAAGEPGLPVIGTSGVGAEAGAAFASCMGEAAELLAQVQTPAQRQARSEAGEHAVVLHRWPDAEPRIWPLDRCLRRAAPRVRAPAPLSIGCAAGPNPAAAILHAALELVERDAAALWWRGGRGGRPLAREACGPAAALLAGLRRDAARRHTWLLDITSDLGVPCVAAVSLDLDGVGFCCGTAARARLDEAACAALLELCQNELAYAVVQAKRAERGDAALNARDLAMLQRLGRVRAEPAWLIHPAGAPAGAALTGAEPEARMAALGQRLTEAGLELLLFDHSGNTDGMAVWRAVCEGLACEPSSDTPPRLARAIRETGGGPGINAGVPLFI